MPRGSVTSSSLVENSGGAQQRDQLVRSVDQSLEAVEDILSTVLDISRFDAGAVKPELQFFPLCKTSSHRWRKQFAPMAAQKNLKPHHSCQALIVVRSDRKLLRRILQNLISNAIKYTPRGRVLVGGKRVGSNVQLRVYDTGLGIPESQRKTIFQEFERLGRDKGVEPGLGLGLSIVERMSRVLKHPLKLTSVVNKGSVFCVTVPVGKGVDLPTATVSSIVQSTATPLRGIRVLAVDNETAIVEGLTALLSGWGVEVVTATSAAEAIERGSTGTRFDAILADYHIHREDGIELVKALRHQMGRIVPAMLITADRSVRVRELAEANDIVHLKKPVKPAALRAALSQLAVRKAAE